MKKIFFTILAFTIFVNSYSQKFGESKIVITLSDTSMIYEKVKFAFEKSDFTIKDDNNKDTLTTSPKSIFNPFGYAFIKAIITGNVVTLSGWYRQMPIGGNYENKEDPKIEDYKRIIYFQNSSTWRVMNKVAQELKKEKINKENIQPNISKRSKEVRLRELKDLFEKELITKEEYERAKQKILDEQ